MRQGKPICFLRKADLRSTNGETSSNPFDSANRCRKSLSNPFDSLNRCRKSLSYPSDSLNRCRKSLSNPFDSAKRCQKSSSYPFDSANRCRKSSSNPFDSAKRCRKSLSNPFDSAKRCWVWVFKNPLTPLKGGRRKATRNLGPIGSCPVGQRPAGFPLLRGCPKGGGVRKRPDRLTSVRPSRVSRPVSRSLAVPQSRVPQSHNH